MKKLIFALTAFTLTAPAFAMGSGPGDVPQGTTPVARAEFDELTVRYTCSQGWLATRPQYSTAKKAQAQHYGRASIAYSRDNLSVFVTARDATIKVITDLRIPC